MQTLEEKKRRLLKLADFLDDLPKGRFYYGAWSQGCEFLEEASCGTNACAFGWAPSIPEFKDMGLKLVHGIPSVNGNLADTSARLVFGLDKQEFMYLFQPSHGLIKEDLSDFVRGAPISPSAKATAADVAAHIRRFVESKHIRPPAMDMLPSVES